MMLRLLCLGLLLLPGWSVGQTGYRWAFSSGGPGYYDTGLDVDVDAAGNVYLAAEFEDETMFQDSLLYSQGGPDLLIAKLNPMGELVWMHRAGSSVHDRAYAIDATPEGSVFMAGYGKIAYPQIKGSSLHTRDALCARHRNDGSFVWGRYMDGDQYSEGRDVVGDADGNCYLTGALKVNGWYPPDTLWGHGLDDAYLVRFDSLGHLDWGFTIGGPAEDAAWAMAIDGAGDLVVAGFFSQTADFGGSSLNAAGNRDGFVAKYNVGGNLIWAKAIGGPGIDEVIAVKASADGSIYFTGSYTDSIVSTAGTIVSEDFFDIFYGKLDADGNLVWLKTAGGANMNKPQDIDIDGEENIYIGGFFFGSLTFDTVTANSVAFDNLFFVKLDSAGNLVFMETSLYGDSREVIGLAVDAAQNIALTGFYSQVLFLGADTLVAHDFTIDLYVAKYASADLTLEIDSLVGSPYCGSDLFTVHFSMTGMPEGGNVFYLELSDANGSFADPDTVGQLAGQLGQQIVGQIPQGLPPGTGYRVRIVCSAPQLSSADNGQDITLNAATAVPVEIVGDTVLCGGVPLLLLVDQGLSSQLWSTGDTSYYVYVNQAGPVWVEASDSNGCSNRDAVLVVECVSAEEETWGATVRVVPNPARDVVQVRLAEKGRVALVLVDGLGRIVWEGAIGGQGSAEIGVGHLPRGMYVLKGWGVQGQFYRRVVLE